MAALFKHSKVRNTYGVVQKKCFWYEGFKYSTTPDVDLVKGNCNFIACILESISGGIFTVLKHSDVGRRSDRAIFSGHNAPVLDLGFNPFNDSILASSSEDGMIMIWDIPAEGEIASQSTPLEKLEYHEKKVTHVLFHPTVNNCLASVSADLSIGVWDLDRCAVKQEIQCHNDIVQSICWNYNGTIMASTCKDKNIRHIDVRSGKEIECFPGHTGTKSSRILWLGNSGYFLTTGFSRMGGREILCWDRRSLTGPLSDISAGSGSGVIVPFFDEDMNIMYAAGKGDGSVHYYEWHPDEANLTYISSHNDSAPIRGICLLPKAVCSVEETEVARFIKAVDNHMEPLSFKIPRRTKNQRSDFHTQTRAGVPALKVEEFFSGFEADPILISSKDLNNPKRMNVNPSRPDTDQKAPSFVFSPISGPAEQSSDHPDGKYISNSEMKSLENYIKELEETNRMLSDKVAKLQLELCSHT